MKATRGGTFTPVPLPKPATVFARCYSVIDIGTVSESYQNQAPELKRKVHITWELPSLLGTFNEEKGRQPFVISLEITATTGDKSNLSKLISQWRNKPFTAEEQNGFDPATMIGKCGFISFIHNTKSKYKGQEIKQVTNENTAMKFNGIMPVPEGVAKPAQVNPYFNWDWDKCEKEPFNKEEFEKIPKFLQTKMAESLEFKKYAKGYVVGGQSAQAEAEPEPEAEKTVTETEGDW